MSHAVLIIDDEETLAKNIRLYLTRHGYEARTASSGEEGLAVLDHFNPDLVLLDVQLPGMDGLETLRCIRTAARHVKVVMMTAHGGVQAAVEAMKAGAYDYLTKPLALSEVKLLLDTAVGQERLEGALAYYQNRQAERSGLDKLLGESPPMQALKRKIRQFVEAEARLTEGAPPAVLITGETGAGKELVARAFHFEGPRRDQPFVELNCASIPTSLLEAELFGFERGAFTDAKERKLGLVETASGGTLFLDEIGDMELALQAKLLKLLEDRRLRRLGGLRDQTVDIRVIAATHQRLEERVRQGWPGNVRELRNSIEHAVLLADEGVIDVGHLALCPALLPMPPLDDFLTRPGQDFPDQGIDLEKLEQRLIVQALRKTSWNVTRAAKLLSLSRDTLRYRMEKYRLLAEDA